MADLEPRQDGVMESARHICTACNNGYLGELTVPDNIWDRIAPVEGTSGGGLLCPNCIVERIVRAGIAFVVHGRTRQTNVVSRLTTRESQVLGALLAGLSNKEIARLLSISPRTAEVHRSRIMEKIGATSSIDLALRVVRRLACDGTLLPWFEFDDSYLPDAARIRPPSPSIHYSAPAPRTPVASHVCPHCQALFRQAGALREHIASLHQSVGIAP